MKQYVGLEPCSFTLGNKTNNKMHLYLMVRVSVGQGSNIWSGKLYMVGERLVGQKLVGQSTVGQNT